MGSTLWFGINLITYNMWSLLSFVFWWSSIISLSNLRAKDMNWQHHRHYTESSTFQWYIHFATYMSNNFKEFNIDILNDNISSGLKIKVNAKNTLSTKCQEHWLSRHHPSRNQPQKDKQQRAQNDILWVSLSPLFRFYLSPMTRRRSDMSTWPTLTSSPPVSLFPLAAQRVFCAPCRGPVGEKDDRKSQTWGCPEHF